MALRKFDGGMAATMHECRTLGAESGERSVAPQPPLARPHLEQKIDLDR
jgi:hypothetical protein